MLHQQAPIIAAHMKRAVSRSIDQCPDSLYFLWSRCVRSQGAQAYSIVCSAFPDHEGGRSIRWGACDEQEVCVDGHSSAPFNKQSRITTVAWCVSQENFVRIAMTTNPSRTLPSSVEAGFHPVDGYQYSAEALLTSLDSKKTVVSQSLEIQAQTVDVSVTLSHGGVSMLGWSNAPIARV